MTDLDVYQPAAVDGYQARMVMTPDQARELDEQVRRCTEAVLREGTDYGVIPGTSGEKTLWRPGAQKLLQWFGLGYSCERIEVERDDAGRKHGITYKCTVARRLPDGTLDVKATCEGTADYDESKFYQDVETVKARLREQEHKWAAKDRRAPNADRWNSAREYRADWNALMKRAQKRAIVGAVVDATAAGGIFADREEDDTPAPQDDGPTWYEQALERALTSTEIEPGGELQALFAETAQAHRDGLINRRQQDHIQNTIRQRVKKLQNVKVVDVEDLGRQAAAAATEAEPDPTPPAAPADTATGTDSSTAPAADGPSENGDPFDVPGTVLNGQLTNIWTVLTGVYKFGRDEKDQARAICAHIARRKLATTKEMSKNEAKTVLQALDSWRETAEQNQAEPREFLIELMATAEKQGGDGDGE